MQKKVLFLSFFYELHQNVLHFKPIWYENLKLLSIKEQYKEKNNFAKRQKNLLRGLDFPKSHPNQLS